MGGGLDFEGLGEYRRAYGKCPRLTREEEQQAVLDGDFDTLILSQLPWTMKLAHGVAAKFGFRDLPLLVSAGTLALVKAVHSFDPDRGFRLTTYVCRPVTWACFSEMRKSTGGCAPRRSTGQFVPTETWGDRPPAVCFASDGQDHVDNVEFAELVLKSLTPRDAEVLWGTAMDIDQAAMAREYGISRQRVHQIKKRAVTKARENFAECGG